MFEKKRSHLILCLVASMGVSWSKSNAEANKSTLLNTENNTGAEDMKKRTAKDIEQLKKDMVKRMGEFLDAECANLESDWKLAAEEFVVTLNEKTAWVVYRHAINKITSHEPLNAEFNRPGVCALLNALQDQFGFSAQSHLTDEQIKTYEQKGFIKKAGENIWEFIVGASEVIKEKTIEAAHATANTLGHVKDKVVDLTSSAVEKASHAFESVKEEAKEEASTVGKTLQKGGEKAKEVATEVKEKVVDLAHKAKDKVTTAAHKVKNAVTGAYEEAKEGAQDLKEKASEKSSELKEKAKEKASELKGKAKEALKNTKEKGEKAAKWAKEKEQEARSSFFDQEETEDTVSFFYQGPEGKTYGKSDSLLVRAMGPERAKAFYDQIEKLKASEGQDFIPAIAEVSERSFPYFTKNTWTVSQKDVENALVLFPDVPVEKSPLFVLNFKTLNSLNEEVEATYFIGTKECDSFIKETCDKARGLSSQKSKFLGMGTSYEGKLARLHDEVKKLYNECTGLKKKIVIDPLTLGTRMAVVEEAIRHEEQEAKGDEAIYRQLKDATKLASQVIHHKDNFYKAFSSCLETMTNGERKGLKEWQKLYKDLEGEAVRVTQFFHKKQRLETLLKEIFDTCKSKVRAIHASA